MDILKANTASLGIGTERRQQEIDRGNEGGGDISKSSRIADNDGKKKLGIGLFYIEL